MDRTIPSSRRLLLAVGAVVAATVTGLAGPAAAELVHPILPQKIQAPGPTCAESSLTYSFLYRAEVDDLGDGTDVVAVLVLDGDGSVLDHDLHLLTIGAPDRFATGLADLDAREPIDNSQLELRLVDVTEAPAGGSELDTSVLATSFSSPILSSRLVDLRQHLGDACDGLPHGGFDTFPLPPQYVLCEAPASNPFSDLDENGVHTANVACAAERRLVRGGPAGLPATSFGPQLATSRAQLAGLVWNLLQEAGVMPVAAPDAFEDDDGIVHEQAIDQLAALGVIGGNGESGVSFDPARPTTRSEMASFMARSHQAATGAALPAGRDLFLDDDTDPAEADVNALAAAGLVSGKASHVYDPAATVTREQIATFFVNLLARIAE